MTKIVDKFGNPVTSADVDRLHADPAFQAIIDKVRSDQIATFVQSSKFDTDTREEAHAIIRALDKIEQALRSIVTAEAIKLKREEGRSK